ncbi:hypothetical protein ACQKE0_04275 [Shewanella colwelliana]|uniref:hypothetical protein n=1 Tax=Shewanella colwelliana TaxID=23 RepID=UPI003CFD5ADC
MPNHINELEKVLKELSIYEKQGLDTSYLKSFIKQYKMFLQLNDIKPDLSGYSDKKKFNIISEIMNDKTIFPTIRHIILFANEEMDLEFKSQKTSRETTISRILKRVEKDPEFKQKLKKSLLWLIDETGYEFKSKSTSIKRENNSSHLEQWVKMLKDL